LPLLEEGRVRAPGGGAVLGEDDRVVVVAKRVMQSPGRVGQPIAERVHRTDIGALYSAIEWFGALDARLRALLQLQVARLHRAAF
jgi:hypothetical protein